jgi:septum formation protein
VYHCNVRLVLASASPRRAELLANAGFEFDIMPVELDETIRHSESPRDYVARLAKEKADAISRRIPDRFVLGADTTVVCGGRILGKPTSDEDAAEMLRSLSGTWHEVLTGVAVRCNERHATDVASTAVHFARLTEAEIAWYVASGEPRDKAGSYAVQGLASRFVDRVEGSYSNVVGLPIGSVYRLLEALGGL